jgi:Protein of unknown function (DUF2975)
MPVENRSENLAWFQTLNHAFWVLWIALPVMIGSIIWMLNDPAAFLQGLTPEQAKCVEIIPRPTNFSLTGKLLFWGQIAFTFSFYVVLLAMFHGMVRRFAQGHIFVSETLGNMQWIGAIMIAYPFAEWLLNSIVNYALLKLGDSTMYATSYMVDIGPIAVGTFLIALKHVLERAISLKSENDLTV